MFFGEIKGSFAFNIPEVHWENFSHYVQPAITIALLGSIESLLSAVVADGMIGSHHRSNTELIGQGIANVITLIGKGNIHDNFDAALAHAKEALAEQR